MKIEPMLSDPWDEAPNVGTQLLDDVHAFLGRFVAYPSAEAQDAHTLWIAHAHCMDAWDSTPRLAFLSPEPGSGKTRALEVTELLVPRPILTVNATAAFVFRRAADEAGLPTILADEIDTVFGPNARQNEELRGFYNAGHRRGAVAGRCVYRGKIIETEEFPAYCPVAMAGLGNLPDTILTRSIIIRMRRRAQGEIVEPYRRRDQEPVGSDLKERLGEWIGGQADHLTVARPVMPAGVEDRDADVWEPLLAIAELAGGGWPERARVAAVALVALQRGCQRSLGLKLLSDIREVFVGADQMPTAVLLERLNGLEESPWGDLKGKPLDSRRLARLLGPYDVKSINIRTAAGVAKGYRREDFHDVWGRYLPQDEGRCGLPSCNATSATLATCPRCDGTGCGWCEAA